MFSIFMSPDLLREECLITSHIDLLLLHSALLEGNVRKLVFSQLCEINSPSQQSVRAFFLAGFHEPYLGTILLDVIYAHLREFNLSIKCKFKIPVGSERSLHHPFSICRSKIEGCSLIGSCRNRDYEFCCSVL